MGITYSNDISKGKAERILWIDIMKGILICLMVFGHCGAPFTKVIYMFHMPAFMFLSGYTTRPERHNILSYLWTKCKSILFPYVLWNTIFLIFYSYLGKCKIYLFFDEDKTFSLINFFKYLHTTDLGGATWFLPVIFTASVMYQVIFSALKIFSKEKFAPYISILVGVIGFNICQADMFLPYLFDLSLYTMLYYGLGQLFIKYDVLEARIPKRDMTVLCIAAIILFGYYYPKLMMNWPTRDFVGLTENIASSICGIYICYRASVMLLDSGIITKILKLLGENTIIVLIFHFLIFKVIFAIFIFIGIEPLGYLRNLTPLNNWPMQWAIVAIGTLAICSVLSAIVSRSKILKFLFSGRIGS